MTKNMTTYAVRLHDGTVGYVTSRNAPKLGYEMTVTVRRANGESAVATGLVEEVRIDNTSKT